MKLGQLSIHAGSTTQYIRYLASCPYTEVMSGHSVSDTGQLDAWLLRPFCRHISQDSPAVCRSSLHLRNIFRNYFPSVSLAVVSPLKALPTGLVCFLFPVFCTFEKFPLKDFFSSGISCFTCRIPFTFTYQAKMDFFLVSVTYFNYCFDICLFQQSSIPARMNKTFFSVLNYTF